MTVTRAAPPSCAGSTDPFESGSAPGVGARVRLEGAGKAKAPQGACSRRIPLSGIPKRVQSLSSDLVVQCSWGSGIGGSEGPTAVMPPSKE